MWIDGKRLQEAALGTHIVQSTPLSTCIAGLRFDHRVQ